MFKQRNINMLSGRLVPNLILYTLPLIASGILQLLYNAADVVVVGRWAGSQSLAAVGSCGALINLITNLFLGLSVGTSVVVAQRIGAGQYQDVSRAVQTAILLSTAGGVVLAAVGFFFSHQALVWMDSPDDVIDLATLYMKIYFLGLPGVTVYNFGAAVLRAAGDTRRPLIILTVSGLVNVVLNLIFVICFQMGVAGVALATAISQYISAGMVLICLIRSDTCTRLELKDMRLDTGDLAEMVRIGLPAGLQGTLFSFSNVIIQSTVNSFGSVAVAGNAASANLEGFIYISMNSLYHTALTFSGQNFGALQYRRSKKALLDCELLVAGLGLLLGAVFYLFRYQLLAIYAPGQQDVIAAGAIRANVIFLTYFTCGTMDVMVGGLRGLGYSVLPMIVSLLGACGFRLVWIFTVFPHDPTLKCLYTSYPISWIITTAVHIICYLFVIRHLPQDGQPMPFKKKTA